jgi:hypothetical protein
MADQFTHDLKRLLTLFQRTWAERDALRIMHTVERVAGDTANWEKILQAAQTRAQEIFQPALSDLDNAAPLTLVLETLLERLGNSRK